MKDTIEWEAEGELVSNLSVHQKFPLTGERLQAAAAPPDNPTLPAGLCVVGFLVSESQTTAWETHLSKIHKRAPEAALAVLDADEWLPWR